jgi:hypothetical protein
MVKPWQVVLATIGIFLAGLVTGGAIAFRGVKVFSDRQKAKQQQQQQLNTQLHPGTAEQMGPQLIRRIATADELNLAPAQRFRINQIAKTAAEKLARLRRETTLSSLLVIEEMQDEISTQLSPTQRTKFELLLTDQRDRMLKFKQNQQNDLHPSDSPQAAPAGPNP